MYELRYDIQRLDSISMGFTATNGLYAFHIWDTGYVDGVAQIEDRSSYTKSPTF